MTNSCRISGRDPRNARLRTVHIVDGRIADIRDGGDDDGAWLSAGLFDIQINGFGGHDFNGATTAEEVIAATYAVIASGTSLFLPTIITACGEAMLNAMRAIRLARAADPLVKNAIPAIHVEGPHISEDDGPRGAHPAAHVCPPDLSLFEAWQEASGGIIGLVTLSPHWPDSAGYIAALVSRGVRVGIGHTMASAAQIREAAAAGARLSTHLGNGIAAMLPRHPNPIWTQLADERLSASFIGDGHHLDDDVLKAMLRAKGFARSILISDAVSLAGMPAGRYDVPIGGIVDLLPNGRLQVAGTPFLAGATTSLLRIINRVTASIGLTLAEALQLAVDNPRRLLSRPGFEVGSPADLLRFRWAPGQQLKIEDVFVGGLRFNTGT